MPNRRQILHLQSRRRNRQCTSSFIRQMHQLMKKQLFCTNMCLFAKLFMADKSVYYEVKGFVFYTIVETTPPASPGAPPLRRVLGFFSKEKMSWDDYNLACILIFPPFQRKGLGRRLIAYSYLLSKIEDKVGSPEKRKFFLHRNSCFYLPVTLVPHTTRSRITELTNSRSGNSNLRPRPHRLHALLVFHSRGDHPLSASVNRD